MIRIFIASNKIEMLAKCVLDNRHIARHPKMISLGDDFAGLPKRNNAFIEQVLRDGEDCWLIFQHDDVALLEDPEEKIETLPKDKIYGLCGVKKVNGKGEITGQIKQPEHEGSYTVVHLGRQVEGYEQVDTFDSLCTIVHSSLFKWNPDLRFDENLQYHMHVEELSINAKKNYGIESAVVQINCIHMSWGSKPEVYHQAVEYVKKKHNLEAYVCTCEKRCLDKYADNEGWKCRI